MSETQVVNYNVEEAAIAKMENDYMALTVKGLDDEEGFKAVHKARMVVKGIRIDVEKRRKALKADALEWGKKVDSEAKRIFNRIEPIETHLTKQEEVITKEQERIRAEKERKLQEAAQARCDTMARIGVALSYAQSLTMTEDDFAPILADALARYDAEQALIAEEKRLEQERIETERKSREAEAAKLAEERAEIEKLRAEQDRIQKEEEAKLRAEREKIEAERRAVENARHEQEHKAAVEAAKKEAAEKAIREAKEQAEREAREKAEAERLAKEEAARQEALRPDKEKIIAYASKILTVPLPDVSTQAAKEFMKEIKKRVSTLEHYIIKAAQEL